MSSKKALGVRSQKSRAMEDKDKERSSPDEEPQDVDYNNMNDDDVVVVPSLSDEVETLILARFPRAEYWKLTFLNKRFLSLVKTGEIYNIRRHIGFKEPSVFMLASGETNWWAFDRHFM